MRIVICSDIHDNIWQLDTMLQQAAGCDELIFCGDFCAPFTLSQIGEGFAGLVHVVWGNNDGDKWLLTRNARAWENVKLHGDFAELEIGGRSIAVNHYPGIAGPLASSRAYDAVFYGHDHTPLNEWNGSTLLLNPGEVMGRFGRSTYAVYDTETGQGSFHEIQ